MPNNMEQGFVGGWRIDEENWDDLDSLPGENEVLAMRGHYEVNDFDAREILKVENQMSQGACQGHAISSALEMASCIAIGQKSLELSRAMGYYETQRLDGINGDRGSTISGGVKLAMNTGICREDLWKYPGNKYNNRRPAHYDTKCLASAKRFMAGSRIRIESWNGFVTFLEAGLGAINLGIRWNNSVNMEHVTDFRGGSGGGHALCAAQMSKKREGEGDILNSWDERWGDKGWATWNQRAVEKMFRDKFTVFIGVSDMENLEPRKVSFTEFSDQVSM